MFNTERAPCQRTPKRSAPLCALIPNLTTKGPVLDVPMGAPERDSIGVRRKVLQGGGSTIPSIDM
eukprot:3761514-Alexandrium_andersonii.AAC.1